MPLFGRKTVILETDEEKAKKQLFRMVWNLPFDSQKNYKRYLRAGTLGLLRSGEVCSKKTIYYIHQDKLYRIPRK